MERPLTGNINTKQEPLDRRGYERTAYLYPFLSRYVSEDLRKLAAGRRT